MPISAFAQKHRTTRYMQNLMTPPRGPYPSATPPVLMVIPRYYSANFLQTFELKKNLIVHFFVKTGQ